MRYIVTVMDKSILGSQYILKNFDLAMDCACTIYRNHQGFDIDDERKLYLQTHRGIAEDGGRYGGMEIYIRKESV